MMLDQDPAMRLHFAREHAERLAEEMRRARGLTPDEVGYPRWGRLASELFGRVRHLRRDRGSRVPALDV